MRDITMCWTSVVFYQWYRRFSRRVLRLSSKIIANYQSWRREVPTPGARSGFAKGLRCFCRGRGEGRRAGAPSRGSYVFLKKYSSLAVVRGTDDGGSGWGCGGVKITGWRKMILRRRKGRFTRGWGYTTIMIIVSPSAASPFVCVHRDGYTAAAPVHVPSFPIACANTTIIIIVYTCIYSYVYTGCNGMVCPCPGKSYLLGGVPF